MGFAMSAGNRLLRSGLYRYALCHRCILHPLTDPPTTEEDRRT